MSVFQTIFFLSDKRCLCLLSKKIKKINIRVCFLPLRIEADHQIIFRKDPCTHTHARAVNAHARNKTFAWLIRTCACIGEGVCDFTPFSPQIYNSPSLAFILLLNFHERCLINTGCPKMNAPLWGLLYSSDYKHARRLVNITFER